MGWIITLFVFQAALNGTSAARRQLVKQSNPIEYTLRRQAIAVPF